MSSILYFSAVYTAVKESLIGANLGSNCDGSSLFTRSLTCTLESIPRIPRADSVGKALPQVAMGTSAKTNEAMNGKLTMEQIKLRGTLLGTNKELLQLHRTLVRGGLITEEEFWETRQALLDNQQTLLNQKRPPPSILGSDLRPVGEQQGEQKFILTPESVQAILSQSPCLLRAHNDLVPGKMAEKDFWVWYIKSRFFLGPTSSETSGNPLNDYYDDELKEKQEVGNFSIAGSTKAATVSRLVDLKATADDHFSDYGNASGNLRHIDPGVSLIRKFNSHSLKIVETTFGKSSTEGATVAPPISIEDVTILEDLIIAPLNETTPLQLGAELRIKRVASAASTDTVKVKIDKEKMRNLKEMSFNMLQIIEKIQLTSAERKKLFDLHLIKGSSTNNYAEGEVEAPTDVSIFNANAREVLQHYWTCHPIGKDANRLAKANRMKTILEQLKIKGKELIHGRSTAEEQNKAEILLSTLMSCIDKALSHSQCFDHENYIDSKRIKFG